MPDGGNRVAANELGFLPNEIGGIQKRLCLRQPLNAGFRSCSVALYVQ